MSELGISPNTTTGRKIEDLAKALETLSIEDDVKEIIEGHLRELKKDTVKPPKIKDLVVFDPSKQKLRSWLTVADNFVYNQRLEGEENKVRAVGSYLRELAWDWFEPVLNEANNAPRTEWEARTRRIMGNYREFKKALGKVFGQIDERKTAAEKLARLRQTTSVTLYMTEFQTIASNLDWDDEALEDKFLEGFQRRPFAGTGRGFYGRGPVVKKDGEGDVIMKGAKVDIEKAKKERLCFHCGKPGHQAKFCRARKREAGRNGPTIRMLRTGITNESMLDSSGSINDDKPASELSIDLKTSDEEKPDELEEPTDEKDIPEELEKRIQDWRQSARSTVAIGQGRGNMRRTRGGRTPHLRRITPRYTGEWPNEHESRPVAMARSAAQGIGTVQAYPETTTEVENCLRKEEKLNRQGDADGLGSLGTYDFGKLLETKDMPWQERVGYFNDKPLDRVKEANWETEICNCYSYRVYWAFTKDTWSEHIQECLRCEEWEERECVRSYGL
jgi:hypothetical protein